MFSSSRFAPPLSMTLTVLVAFVVLLGLGTWQLQRLLWKQGLIAQYERNIQAPVVAWQDIRDSVTAMPRPDHDPYHFSRVKLVGEFVHDKEMYMTGRSRNGEPGLMVITPFVLQDGSVVAVSRGWIESEYRAPHTRAAGLFTGPQTLEAMYRRAIPVGGLRASILPENDTHKNTWYTLDLPAMAAFVDLPMHTEYYFMDAREGDPMPYGRQWIFRISNNHLQYAITWYALAFCLIGMYVAFGVKRARELTAQSIGETSE